MAFRYSVTFVCMGNICRSPTAHGVFRQRIRAAGLAKVVRVDSAGTLDAHSGAPPDPRAQRHAAARGYDLSDLRARALAARDFERADLLLVMDDDNLATVERRCPPEHLGKLRRLTEFCRAHRVDAVPDPYFGGPDGFEHVLDLVEDACEGLFAHVLGELRARGAA
jgi:protein-tyrosine phosphatase